MSLELFVRNLSEERRLRALLLSGFVGAFVITPFVGLSTRVKGVEDFMNLQGSPMAKELRYQIWKRDPNHPGIQKYRYEFEVFQDGSEFEDRSRNLQFHLPSEYSDAF